MSVIDLDRLLELESAASPAPWTTEHSDRYVAGPTIDGDWDWIAGPIVLPDDGYSGEMTDADCRGNKIEANCRLIAAMRNNIKALIECAKVLKLAVDERDWSYETDQRARDALAKLEGEK